MRMVQTRQAATKKLKALSHSLSRTRLRRRALLTESPARLKVVLLNNSASSGFRWLQKNLSVTNAS